MKKVLIILFGFIPSLLLAGTYYVSTSGGSDGNPGTFSQPFATLQYATDQLSAGDTLYVRGGVFYPQARISSGISGAWVINPDVSHGATGTPSAWIHIFAYPVDLLIGSRPVLDCSQFDNGTSNYMIGLVLSYVQFYHIKGLEIRHVWQNKNALAPEAWGVQVSRGANFIFENMTVHDISGRGWWYSSGAWTPGDSAYAVSLGTTPENARITCAYDTTSWINCDTYDLCDSIDYTGGGDPGNSADGWKCVFYGKNKVTWDRCRAWHYTDDGWDPSLSARDYNHIGPDFQFYNCWAASTNKYLAYCDSAAAEGKGGIEGNGFKFGAATGDTVPVNHTIHMYNCLAMFCNTAGFLENIEINGVSKWDCRGRFYNLTSYKNEINIDIQNVDNLPRDLIIRNTLSYESTGTYWQYLAKIYYPSVYTESNNTWVSSQREDVGSFSDPWTLNTNFTVSDADFVTTDSTALMALFTANRSTDFTLPLFPLRLVSDSDLLNKGIAIPESDSAGYTLTYYGTSPDIGAYQYNPQAMNRRTGKVNGVDATYNGRMVK